MNKSGPVAVLHQAAPVPIVNGSVKPMKPGGYADSSADIAFALAASLVPVVTPGLIPDPAADRDWSFPDTFEGIQEAVDRDARILWANTTLYRGHAIERVDLQRVRIVGQRPDLVERFEDKWTTRRLLESAHIPMPRAILAGFDDDDRGGIEVHGIARISRTLLASRGLEFPVVAKPLRGRGSEGVRRIDTHPQLEAHVTSLLTATIEVDGVRVPRYGDRVIIEEYVPGAEITITVLPPGLYFIDGADVRQERHWTLPPVARHSHENGIAPYNGEVAIVRNSRLLDRDERSERAISQAEAHAATVAALIGALAPIRVDCRADAAGVMRLFDINLKPNITGPGRPGRDDQESLISMAARGIGWSYRVLLLNLLRQSWRPE